MEENKQVSWLGFVLTALLGAAGSYFTLKGTQITGSAAQLEVTYNRIENLETRNATLSQSIRQLNTELALLTARYEMQYMPRAALFSYLEAIDAPAWLKAYDKEKKMFYMLYINRAYENYYKVTKARYLGSTDFDVQPKEIAEGFFKHDMEVYKERGFKRVDEKVFHKGELLTLDLWKFYLKLPDDTEVVAGIQVTPWH